jgi:hypothetical protein
MKRVWDVRVNAVSTCRLALDSEKTSHHRGCCWRRESCVTEASATDASRFRFRFKYIYSVVCVIHVMINKLGKNE